MIPPLSLFYKSYFPRGKKLITPEKTALSKVDQFHVPFLNKLVKVVIVTTFLMISASIIIPALCYLYSSPPQIASSDSKSAEK